MSKPLTHVADKKKALLYIMLCVDGFVSKACLAQWRLRKRWRKTAERQGESPWGEGDRLSLTDHYYDCNFRKQKNI